MTKAREARLETVARFLTLLARENVPPHIQEVLCYGDAQLGVKPGALERAIAALPSCEEWRQFDTAPEDGTEIIVWRADSGVFTSFYREADWWIATPTRPPEEDAAWFATTGEDLSDDLPTHWMPLPSPPER